MKLPAIEYPAMLYRRDGTMLEWDGAMFDTIIVADPDECEIAIADGWFVPGHEADPLDHDGDGRKGGARKAKAG